MRKPVHQAEVSKAAAEENINQKLKILENWALKGIPYLRTTDGNFLLDSRDNKILDFFPKSLRQFKSWDGSQNCELVRLEFPRLATTGNDTLAKRPVQEEEVRKVVLALRLKADSQNLESHPSVVKKLQAELKVANSIISIRNSELREQQRKLLRTGRDYRKLEVQSAGHLADAIKLNAKLAEEIESLKKQNAVLVSQLAKVSPLKVTNENA